MPFILIAMNDPVLLFSYCSCPSACSYQDNTPIICNTVLPCLLLRPRKGCKVWWWASLYLSAFISQKPHFEPNFLYVLPSTHVCDSILVWHQCTVMYFQFSGWHHVLA